ncbi:MAG: hypothetical protein GX800_07540 [Clostridiaceae bacterium]|nr:hypothetical protein [Clostridiaceae bacterium]
MKKASISFVILVSLVILCGGAAIFNIAAASRYRARTEYERIENRYISESGIDLAVGLFINYLSNQDYVLAYSQNGDGNCQVLDEYSPYLLDEIKIAENLDDVPLDLISTESADYLSAIGYLDFKRDNGIELSISTYEQKDNFKLSRLCIEPYFLIGRANEVATVKSKINPIHLTVKSAYKGGEILCNVQISDLYISRQPFKESADEISSVSAGIDTSYAKIIYENYQNYGRSGN